MTLADLTRPAVLAAIEERERLGRDGFLRATGFRRGVADFLDYGGQLYDSKPIVAYAHGIATGMSLTYLDLSGRRETVARRLRELGFVVRGRRLDWTRDEIVLACALVEANGWRQLDHADPRVADLSQLLQTPAIHTLADRGPDFRNPAGVARKTADIATSHPDYAGKSTNGNHLDREVLEDFRADPHGMRAMATAIRLALGNSDSGALATLDLDVADSGTDEGGVLLRQHLRRERDPNLRQRKIADAKSRGIPIACEVCGFDFGKAYGDRGQDYIECHHRTPLYVTGRTKTRLGDLALICSNCHRMIHRTRPWLTVEELREVVAAQRLSRQPRTSPRGSGGAASS